MHSPVERISGPSTGSVPGNLLNGNTASFTETYGGTISCVKPMSSSVSPIMTRAANDTRYSSPEKAFLSAGLCLRRAGRNAEAEDYLRRAVLIRPDLIGALYNLAAINFERGAINDAEIYLLRYMRLATPNLESLVMGVKIARLKKDKAAEDSFEQQLRRRFPDAPETREILERKP